MISFNNFQESFIALNKNKLNINVKFLTIFFLLFIKINIPYLTY